MGFTLAGFMIPRDGYGQVAIKTGESLQRMGADVRMLDLRINGAVDFPGKKTWKVEGNVVVASVPDWWGDVDTSGKLIGFTMFESLQLPAGRAEMINRRAVACVVPSEFCARVFRVGGVNTLVYVVPLGIDPDVYCLMDRSDHTGPYTFLWSGTPDLRKGWDLVYRAFYAAFGGRRDVQLVMHFRELPRGVTGTQDKNVRLVSGSIGTGEWLDLLRGADCFVFPSRGEGWGLPPREAAATGLPVIATNWGGLQDGISHWGTPLRVSRLVPADFGSWDAGSVGDWAEPDYDHLIELMRWCYENRSLAAKGGEAASHWLTTHATWERTAAELVKVMEMEK